MSKEIERKFLVKGNAWRTGAVGAFYRQGYLASNPGCTVRIRIANASAYLTIKGPIKNITRTEFEYKISRSDAKLMLTELCEKPLIEKTRYIVDFGEMKWEIDEFEGENKGLVLAEIELESENQKIKFPHWIGREVSRESRYHNSNLIHFPYSKWT